MNVYLKACHLSGLVSKDVPGIPIFWTLLLSSLKGGEGCRLQVANNTCMRLSIVNHADSQGHSFTSCELTIASRAGSHSLGVPGEAAAARAELGGQGGAGARQLAVQQHLLRHRRRRVAQRCTAGAAISLGLIMQHSHRQESARALQAQPPTSQISAAYWLHCSHTQRPSSEGEEMNMRATHPASHSTKQAALSK